MSDHGSVGGEGGEAPAPDLNRCGRQPTPIGAGQAARELAQRADLRLKSPGAAGMLK